MSRATDELGKRRQSRGLAALLRVSHENRQLVEKYLREEISELLREDRMNEAVLTTGLYLTRYLAPTFEEAPVASPQDREYWERVERELFDEVHPALVAQSECRAWCAVLRAMLGEVSFASVIESHGVLALYQFQRAGQNFDPPLAYSIIRALLLVVCSVA
jgi:hypothetical protein